MEIVGKKKKDLPRTSFLWEAMDDDPSKKEEGRGCSKQEMGEWTGWAGGEGTIQPFRQPDVKRPDGSTRTAP